MGHLLSTVALGPLLLAQGRWARRRTPRLPEPPGPRIGVAGAGPEIRILVTGDSAAAGVGAAHQDEALLGRIVAELAHGFRVRWTLCARSGATTASTLAALDALGPARFDVVVTSLGVNDVVAGVSRAAWRRRQTALRAQAREGFGASCVVISGLPPVHGFPALPQPLRWHLGRRARAFDRDLARDVAGSPGCRYLPLDFAMDTRLMASDGFHPGPVVYAGWGRRVAALVREAWDARTAA